MGCLPNTLSLPLFPCLPPASPARNGAACLNGRHPSQGPDGSKPEWPADRLLFINDVFFCAKDVWRLLQHSSADIACGMDFYVYSQRHLSTQYSL